MHHLLTNPPALLMAGNPQWAGPCRSAGETRALRARPPPAPLARIQCPPCQPSGPDAPCAPLPGYPVNTNLLCQRLTQPATLWPCQLLWVTGWAWCSWAVCPSMTCPTPASSGHPLLTSPVDTESCHGNCSEPWQESQPQSSGSNVSRCREAQRVPVAAPWALHPQHGVPGLARALAAVSRGPGL